MEKANPDRRGAIFLAVFRGEMSEGLDVCDWNYRAMIITGLQLTDRLLGCHIIEPVISNLISNFCYFY